MSRPEEGHRGLGTAGAGRDRRAAADRPDPVGDGEGAAPVGAEARPSRPRWRRGRRGGGGGVGGGHRRDGVPDRVDAVGVGFLVGFAVRYFGKGMDQSFGVVGAVWSLLGCGLGNLLAVCGMVSKEQGIPLGFIVRNLNLEIAADMMAATFARLGLLSASPSTRATASRSGD